jgi:hypothetical protein
MIASVSPAVAATASAVAAAAEGLVKRPRLPTPTEPPRAVAGALFLKPTDRPVNPVTQVIKTEPATAQEPRAPAGWSSGVGASGPGYGPGPGHGYGNGYAQAQEHQLGAPDHRHGYGQSTGGDGHAVVPQLLQLRSSIPPGSTNAAELDDLLARAHAGEPVAAAARALALRVMDAVKAEAAGAPVAPAPLAAAAGAAPLPTVKSEPSVKSEPGADPGTDSRGAALTASVSVDGAASDSEASDNGAASLVDAAAASALLSALGSVVSSLDAFSADAGAASHGPVAGAAFGPGYGADGGYDGYGGDHRNASPHPGHGYGHDGYDHGYGGGNGYAASAHTHAPAQASLPLQARPPVQAPSASTRSAAGTAAAKAAAASTAPPAAVLSALPAAARVLERLPKGARSYAQGSIAAATATASALLGSGASASGSVSATAAVEVADFSRRSLRRQDDGVVADLYDNLPFQCGTCGWRFPDKQARQTHLNKHFEQNMRLKRLVKTVRSQPYYWTEHLWAASVDMRATEDEAERAAAADAAAVAAQAAQVRARAAGVDSDDEAAAELSGGAAGSADVFTIIGDEWERAPPKCFLCGDGFEKAWNDDVDAWVYTGTLRLDLEALGQAHSASARALQGRGGQPMHWKCWRHLLKEGVSGVASN